MLVFEKKRIRNGKETKNISNQNRKKGGKIIINISIINIIKK